MTAMIDGKAIKQAMKIPAKNPTNPIPRMAKFSLTE